MSENRGEKRAESAATVERTWTARCECFEKMNLREELLGGIYASGFETPSSIQRAVVHCIEGCDVILHDHAGSGKTVAVSIAVLQRLETQSDPPRCQVLFLVPTRDVAMATQRAIQSIGDGLSCQCHVCVGGTKGLQDIARLKAGVHVVVGTPGRMRDMISRKALLTDTIRSLVLDEADELLSRGLKDDIDEVFQHLPQNVQVIVSSATLPPDLREMAERLMCKSERILVKREQPHGVLTLDGIKQFRVNVQREECKLDTLCDLLDELANPRAVVFCNTRAKVEWLDEKTRGRELPVVALHADADEQERGVLLREFASGASRILITTGALSHIIDVQSISLVINYDLPVQRKSYLHRVGRRGVAISFVTDEDQPTLRSIEQSYSTAIDQLPMDVSNLL